MLSMRKKKSFQVMFLQQDEDLNIETVKFEAVTKADDDIVNSIQNEESVQLYDKEDKLCNKAKILLQTRYSRLPLSLRTLNVLRHANVLFFKDIPQLTDSQILQFQNCGRKTLVELLELLARYSLEFGLSYPEIVNRLSVYSDDDLELPLNDHSYAEKLSSLMVKEKQTIKPDDIHNKKSSVIKSPLQFKMYLDNKKKVQEKKQKNKNTNSSVINDQQKFKKYIENKKKEVEQKRKKC